MAPAFGEFTIIAVANLHQRLLCLGELAAQFDPIRESEGKPDTRLAGVVIERMIMIPDVPLQRLLVPALRRQALGFRKHFAQSGRGWSERSSREANS